MGHAMNQIVKNHSTPQRNLGHPSPLPVPSPISHLTVLNYKNMADRGKGVVDMDEVAGRTQSKPCQPCGKKNGNNVAEVYCEDCGEYQCNDCAKVHQHFTVMATHKVISISDAEFVSRKYDMKGLDLCKQHGEILKFLCEDDNKLCCSTCAIVNHRKCHSVVEIKEKAKVEGTVLSSLKKDLLDIDSKTKTFQRGISKTKERLEKSEKEIVGKIQDMQDEVHIMFEELKRKVSYDIGTFKEQTMSNLDTKLASCDTYVGNVEKYLFDIENVTQLGTPSQQMIMLHYLKDQVRQLQQNTTKSMEELEDIRLNFEFDEFLKLPPTKSAMPGKLTLEYLTTSKRQEDSKEKQQEDQKVNLKLLASIDLKKSKGDEKYPFYSGLDFLPDGRLVTVDKNNKKCLVYNDQLQLLGSFALSYLPQDVVAVSGTEVAVTTADERLILFLKILDHNKISLKENRNVTYKYESITAMENEHFVVGTVDDSQSVRIVSISGEEKELGITFPTNTYPLGHSKCTYIKSCNKVVLTDRYAHTVYIYDIASNTRVQVGDKTIIKEPRGVTVGPGDCIFVCSENTDSLVQISHTGQILSSYGLDMKYPRSVSVSKDNKKLAVSNSCVHKKKLQLYSIEIQ